MVSESQRLSADMHKVDYISRQREVGKGCTFSLI